jgi:hypothetical protein
MMMIGLSLLSAMPLFSAENVVGQGRTLFGGGVTFSSQKEEGTKTDLFAISGKWGYFVASRLALGPELSYIKTTYTHYATLTTSQFEGGLFLDYFVGNEKGAVLGRLGAGMHALTDSNDHNGFVINPRIALEVFLSKKSAIDIELGYLKAQYSDSTYNSGSPEKTYLSIGLLGFAY